MVTIFKKSLFACLLVAGIFVSEVAFASSDASAGADHGPATTLLYMAVIFLFAALGRLVTRIGQPQVLGELLVGVLLGNLGLVGIHAFDGILSSEHIKFLSDLGVVILLFLVGLESNLYEMKKIGGRAALIATIGVVVPFVLGAWVVGPWLLPGLSTNAYLFLGAALTATSVGITARVFKDFGKLKIVEAQTVLGAAVIDDVLGLIILAVVTAMATVGAVSLGLIGWIIAKAVLFLVGSIVLGRIFAPKISQGFSKIHTGAGLKFAFAIVFALLYSALAGGIGLAPIIGAFAAGLVLDPVHFKYFKKPKAAEDLEMHAGFVADAGHKEELEQKARQHTEKHVEELIEPVGHFLIPIFFVYTGMNVRLETLFDPKILLVALGITAVAVVGKYVSGFAAAKGTNRHIIGFGMVPRGEVGLIFASIGKEIGVLNNETFSVIVIMVILTTLLTPPILAYFLKNKEVSLVKDKNTDPLPAPLRS